MSKKVVAILSSLILVIVLFGAFYYENFLKEKPDNFLVSTETTKELKSIKNKTEFIENAYLVHILAFEKTEELNSEYKVEFLTDDSDINTSLLYIENFLLSFNKDFFKRLCDDKKVINIYLVEDIKKKDEIVNIAGIYYKNSYSYNIVINTTKIDEIPKILAHELMHLIEDFLKEKDIDFANWESLNPRDFSYSKDNLKNGGSDLLSNYFVDNYATVSSSEDRATIFQAIYEGKTFKGLPGLEAKVNYLKEILLLNLPELNYLPKFIA